MTLETACDGPASMDTAWARQVLLIVTPSAGQPGGNNIATSHLAATTQPERSEPRENRHLPRMKHVRLLLLSDAATSGGVAACAIGRIKSVRSAGQSDHSFGHSLHEQARHRADTYAT